MTEALKTTGTVCGVMIATELLSRICPKDKLLGFTQALVALVLLLSACFALTEADWSVPVSAESSAGDSSLTEYVEDQVRSAAKEEAEHYLRGLLAAAEISPKKIDLDIHIGEGNSIELTRVSLTFLYETDAERTRALLGNVLDGVSLEVIVDGA